MFEKKYTVTCAGRAMKACGSRAECAAFIALQKRKIKGAGMIAAGVENHNPALAAKSAWDIRAYKAGDIPSMCESEHAKNFIPGIHSYL